jgi:hypothetical protein
MIKSFFKIIISYYQISENFSKKDKIDNMGQKKVKLKKSKQLL